jgi:hypothetical protein
MQICIKMSSTRSIGNNLFLFSQPAMVRIPRDHEKILTPGQRISVDSLKPIARYCLAGLMNIFACFYKG